MKAKLQLCLLVSATMACYSCGDSSTDKPNQDSFPEKQTHTEDINPEPSSTSPPDAERMSAKKAIESILSGPQTSRTANDSAYLFSRLKGAKDEVFQELAKQISAVEPGQFRHSIMIEFVKAAPDHLIYKWFGSGLFQESEDWKAFQFSFVHTDKGQRTTTDLLAAAANQSGRLAVELRSAASKLVRSKEDLSAVLKSTASSDELTSVASTALAQAAQGGRFSVEAFLQEQWPQPVREQAVLWSSIGKLEKEGGPAAMEYLQSIGQAEITRNASVSVFRRWLGSTPKTATTWLNERQGSPLFQRLALEVASYCEQQGDKEGALQWRLLGGPQSSQN